MDADSLLNLYGQMLLVRRFEERLMDLCDQGQVSGTSHLCIGQEACAVGAVAACRPDDWLVSHHRGHGHLLARGLEPRRMLAELLGRRTGYCGGKGGSQHLCSIPDFVLGTNGITGGGLPLAAGAALALRMRGESRIVLAFFGDGATNQGTFHETLNLAALWKLPVLFVCENNGYGMSNPCGKSIAGGGEVAPRAVPYGIPARVADGMDVEAVLAAADGLQAGVRRGEGPALLELKTYRHCGHSRNDRRVYRSREEEAEWLARDCLVRTAARLRELGLAEARLEAVAARVEQTMAEATDFALNSPVGDRDFARGGVYA